MIRKAALLFLLSVLVTAFTGCETVKGVGKDLQTAREIAYQAPGKTCQAAQEIDAWIRRNLW